MREALANSPTLAQATARLKQAQEESNARTGATKYPSVNASISAQREQVDLATFGVPFPSPPPFGLLNGSVAVSYALDLFGANRRLIESLNAQVEYQNWQLQGARLMLAGNVVSAAIRQAQLRSQIDLTRQMLALQQQQLAITEQRVQAGGLAPTTSTNSEPWSSRRAPPFRRSSSNSTSSTTNWPCSSANRPLKLTSKPSPSTNFTFPKNYRSAFPHRSCASVLTSALPNR